MAKSPAAAADDNRPLDIQFFGGYTPRVLFDLRSPATGALLADVRAPQAQEWS
jgi:hypothetical protein